MTRSMLAVMAMLVAVLTVTSTASAQDAPRRRLVAPVRGEATIWHTRPVTARVGDEVVTTIEVQNKSARPVAGFKVEEFWYDENDQLVPGDSQTVRRPIQPEEIVEIELRTPRNARMNRNNYRFSHANGSVANVIKDELIPPEIEEEAAN